MTPKLSISRFNFDNVYSMHFKALYIHIYNYVFLNSLFIIMEHPSLSLLILFAYILLKRYKNLFNNKLKCQELFSTHFKKCLNLRIFKVNTGCLLRRNCEYV